MSDQIPRPLWLDRWLDYPHGPLCETEAREVIWYAHAQSERVKALEAEKAELVVVLKTIDDDFKYLERTYPGLYSTGAGYVLNPRVIEIRTILARVSDTTPQTVETEAKA